MRSRVYVHPIDPGNPQVAVADAVSSGLEGLPRARPITIVIAGTSSEPGLGIAPWTVNGIRAALQNRGRRVARTTVLSTASLERDPLPLAFPGIRRPAALPREWIGSALVLALPLQHRVTERGSWLGPLASALAQLWQHCREDDEDEFTAGERLVAEVFAGCMIVIDGGWWATSDREGRPMGELISVGVSVAGIVHGVQGRAEAIDGWIASRLGLRHGASAAPDAPLELGPSARRPWPRVTLPVRAPAAGRRLNSLWRPRAVAALRGPAPGPLARIWDLQSSSETT